ncbi:MAG: FliM/FliN family flagellar motor switch protein [Myxococcota bacterium]|nr:FliM/FliN family flagellar motor switch protein [Myxococcota bacterium]
MEHTERWEQNNTNRWHDGSAREDMDELRQRLKEVKALLDMGLVEPEEYSAIKKKILSRLGASENHKKTTISDNKLTHAVFVSHIRSFGKLPGSKNTGRLQTWLQSQMPEHPEEIQLFMRLSFKEGVQKVTRSKDVPSIRQTYRTLEQRYALAPLNMCFNAWMILYSVDQPLWREEESRTIMEDSSYEDEMSFSLPNLSQIQTIDSGSPFTEDSGGELSETLPPMSPIAERFFQRVSQRLHNRWGRRNRKNCEIRLLSIEISRFRGVLLHPFFQKYTVYSALKVSNRREFGLMMMQQSLLKCLGDWEQPESDVEGTANFDWKEPNNQNFVYQFIREVLGDIDTCLASRKLNISCSKPFGTHPGSLDWGHTERVYLGCFEVFRQETSRGLMALAMPASLFEMSHLHESDREEGAFLQQLPVSLVAELEPVMVPLPTVKNWEVGSVIFLDPSLAVSLRVGKLRYFRGRLEAKTERRSIRIDAPHEDDST